MGGREKKALRMTAIQTLAGSQIATDSSDKRLLGMNCEAALDVFKF